MGELYRERQALAEEKTKFLLEQKLTQDKEHRDSLKHLKVSLLLCLKPFTGRPCVPACLVFGTVPTFTCDCLRFVCAFTRRRKVDLCVSTSSRIMLAFEKKSIVQVAHVLLLRLIAGNMDVNTLA